METTIIKTKKEIGKFLNNSFVDNIPLREVTKDDLKNLNEDEYEIINTDNAISIDDVEKIKRDFLNHI
jgi:hypothetical protein